VRHSFTAVYVEGEAGFIVGYAEEYPGAYGQGMTLEEARKSLRGALALQIAATRKDHRKVFGAARVISRERITVE
jgi:predicted RNase H-like HicB family nuclease